MARCCLTAGVRCYPKEEFRGVCVEPNTAVQVINKTVLLALMHTGSEEGQERKSQQEFIPAHRFRLLEQRVLHSS